MNRAVGRDEFEIAERRERHPRPGPAGIGRRIDDLEAGEPFGRRTVALREPHPDRALLGALHQAAADRAIGRRGELGGDGGEIEAREAHAVLVERKTNFGGPPVSVARDWVSPGTPAISARVRSPRSRSTARSRPRKLTSIGAATGGPCTRSRTTISAPGNASVSRACRSGMTATVCSALSVVTSASANPETPSWSICML